MEGNVEMAGKRETALRVNDCVFPVYTLAMPAGCAIYGFAMVVNETATCPRTRSRLLCDPSYLTVNVVSVCCVRKWQTKAQAVVKV